eukprot:scaffold109415_cov30-Tisochrysis_lutea.AAC.1
MAPKAGNSPRYCLKQEKLEWTYSFSKSRTRTKTAHTFGNTEHRTASLLGCRMASIGSLVLVRESDVVSTSLDRVHSAIFSHDLRKGATEM